MDPTKAQTTAVFAHLKNQKANKVRALDSTGLVLAMVIAARRQIRCREGDGQRDGAGVEQTDSKVITAAARF